MAIEAELADGRVLEFPDGTDPSVIQATVKRILASSQPTTVLGNVKEAFKGLVPGAVGLLESAATGASALLPEDMEKSAREKIKSVASAAKAPFAAAPGYEDSVTRKLSEAVGSTAPFLLAGPFGLAGRAAAVGLGVGAGAGESRTRAEEAGATGDQRSTATALGIIPGALEAFAPLRILSRIPTASKAAGVEAVKRALIAGGEEAAQEAASGFAQNLIAKGIYKPEQALIEGLGEQAAYGGATGAIVQGLMDLALGRRARGAAPAPTGEQPAAPSLPLVTAPGVQGELLAPDERAAPAEPDRDLFGKPVVRAPEPAEPPAAGVPEGQQDLGLDFQREYADMATERERLRQQTQTPEVKARVAELAEQMALYTQSDIESIRAEKELAVAAAAEDAATRKKFPALANAPDLLTQSDEVKARTQGELFPGEDLGTPPATLGADIAEPTLRTPKEKAPLQYKLPLRTVPEGREPKRDLTIPARPGELSMQNVQDIGIPLRVGMQPWFEQNVVGKTVPELQQLVKRQPELTKGQNIRAKILRELLAPQPAPFKEKPSEPTPAPTPAVEQRDEPRAGEPSVGVPSEPAAPIVPEPGAGVPVTAGAPVAPDGRGLVSAGRPVVQGDGAQGTKPAAVTPAKIPKPVPVEEEAPKAYEQSPAVVALSQAKTKSQLESALDAIARIRRDPAHVEHEAVNEFLTDALAAPGFEPMFTAALDRTRPRQAPTTLPAEPAEKPTGKAKPARAIPSAFFEPIGVDSRTGAIKRGKQMLVQPIDDKRAAEYLKAKEQADEGDTTDLLALFEEIEQEGDVSDTQGALFDAKGKVTKEAKVKAEPKAKPAPKVEAKPEPVEAKPEPKAPAIAEWAVDYNKPGFTAVFGDDNIALFRAINALGRQIYIGVNKSRNGRYTNTEIESYTGADFTPEQRNTLLAARAKAVFEESKRAANAPDGPFTGATTNVAKSDSVDQRYADLLQDLMRSMGLGDVRIFLLHPEDMRGPDAQAKYKLYKTYETAQTAGFKAGEEGSTQVMGPDKRDFYISFKPGMSENKSIEVITHELGHVIQAIAFNNAPADVQVAIRKEHDAWVQSTKGKTGRELVQMLRNRETADTQMLSVAEGKTAEQMSAYWKSFSEWFADNTSRWASTSDKPVTITEKFFSRVAQMMRDLVAVVTGRKYPPNKKVAEFLDAMGPGSSKLWLTGTDTAAQPSMKASFSTSYTADDVVDSMGALTPIDKRGVLGMFKGAQDSERSAAEPGRGVKFRVAVADSAAAVEDKLSGHFNGAVRDSMGKLNPMGLYRQAQDYSKLLLAYFQEGSLQKEKETGQYKVVKAADGSAPTDVFPLIYAWGERTGRSKERAEQFASRVIEAYRLEQVLKENPDFPKHINDADRALLVAEYNADPAFAKMSAAMDKPRIALVDQMVKVGRLSKEQGDEWKSVIGYVPFDRIDDFAERFTAVKKTTGRSPLMLTKNPELKGSFTRPVGNVFENYLNTMGWMVGQVMTNDARVQTLRSLEDLGYTGKPSRMPGTKHRTAKAYVKGELLYWDLPSSYDVAAFQELNPPKAKWLQVLGQVSNVLRKSVTILPPFALKQVTDDVQRAIMTSGVKNPGALLRMTLSNFGGLALAELRGIRHPTVSAMEALGLTGEFDFQQGKPAVSLLKDLGYRPRGKFETLMHRLEGITRASDLAVRKAIYDQTINESKDQLLAQTRAREFINFRRRGSSDFVGAMVTTIPFFNAYIQGMDVLYRAASGKDSSSSVGRAQARRMFYNRAAIAMTLSTFYALGKGDDDEEYNEMDLRTRDSNWILPGGFKLPVPTELGALFKVVPERIVEYMRRQGTPEEQTAWEATHTALAYIYEQYVGRVVPIPQAAKPLLEAWTNYSFFTGRELEGIYQKQQDPSMRRASNTSELAIAISAFSRDVVGVDKISPILVDNALSGYFGSTAGLLVAMTDSLLNPTRVDRPLHKYALLSNYLYDPVGTRRMTEFYDEREKVGRANATLAELMKTDLDRAVDYAEKHADVLMMESAINSTLEQLERTRAYRKFLNSKDAAADMSATEREAELKEIKQMEVELTGWVREAKTAIRQ